MGFSLELRPSQLKILSIMLTNIATGLILLPLTTLDPLALTISFVLNIVCLQFALKVEDILSET